MEKKELLIRINQKGKDLGYPLFVMSDGCVLKTPPQDIPFKFIVFEELDIEKSLANQGIMKYETWLNRTPSVTSSPEKPEKAEQPQPFQIPKHLKPQIYKFPNLIIYIYAEKNICYFAEEVYDLEKHGIRVHVFETGIEVKQYTVKEKGLDKVYYHIFKK